MAEKTNFEDELIQKIADLAQIPPEAVQRDRLLVDLVDSFKFNEIVAFVETRTGRKIPFSEVFNSSTLRVSDLVGLSQYGVDQAVWDAWEAPAPPGELVIARLRDRAIAQKLLLEKLTGEAQRRVRRLLREHREHEAVEVARAEAMRLIEERAVKMDEAQRADWVYERSANLGYSLQANVKMKSIDDVQTNYQRIRNEIG